MGFLDSLKRGLQRSREAINEIFYMGGEVDEDFWEDLEDTLVMGDMGAEVAMRVTDDLREQAARENLSRAEQLRDALARRLAAEFPEAGRDPFSDLPSTVLFVGINGTGKTTMARILAKAQKEAVDIIAKAHGAVSSERHKAMIELSGSVVDLSVEIASKIIGNDLTEEQQRRLAEKYLAEVGTPNGN